MLSFTLIEIFTHKGYFLNMPANRISINTNIEEMINYFSPSINDIGKWSL